MDQSNILLEYTKFCYHVEGLFDINEYIYLREQSYLGYTEFDPRWKRWMKGGIAASLTVAASGHAIDKGNFVASVAAFPVGMFLSKLYKHKTDVCSQYCGKDKLCYNKCYVDAANSALQKIRADLAEISKIPDPRAKAKIHAKLLKQLKYYEGKRDHFINKARIAGLGMKAKQSTPDTDVYRQRAIDK